MERQILATALADRGDYITLAKYDVRDTLSDSGQILWDCIADYYKTDIDTSQVSITVLKAAIDRKYPKHAVMFHELVENLPAPSAGNLIHEIVQLKKMHVSMELSQAFATSKTERIQELWEEYNLLLAGELEEDDESSVLIAPDLVSIMDERSVENRFQMIPPVLNTALEGGPLRGHHLVIYAVTDMGKTLFVLNLVRGFIEQGLTVLYIGNEDPVSDLIERFLTSLSGKDKFAIRNHPKRAQVFADKKGWERLVWAELTPGTLGEIRMLIEKHKPDVLVVDQIRNLDISTGDRGGNYVLSLQKAAQGMRNFAKKYSLVSVSVTQAADSADGKAILNRGDIDSSNVGIPGTADLMLGIGATAEDEFNGYRTLSFAKNKVSGNKRPVKVFFNTTTMRVE